MGSELGKPDSLLPIEKRIFIFREQQVMLDRDLAELYGVEPKRLNEQVKRNIDRFPKRYRFQLTETEKNELVANCDRFESLKHSSSLPYAFTEQGVAMLSAVLHSDIAVQTSIKIMDAFVSMRKFLTNNAQVFARLDRIEIHQLESDKKIEELFSKMETYGIENRQGIFFQGQIFDAYVFFEKLIQGAKKDIVLIDGYVDITILERLSKKKSGVNVTIYTHPQTTLTNIDVQKFNAQYSTLTLNHTTKMHDRFLIIDKTELYHLGASLKDLGTKCFAFEKMDDAKILIPEILKNI